MHWVSVIMFAIASNLDNLGIGLSFGMKRTRIPWLPNILIACITMIGTYFSMRMGEWLVQFVSSALANWLGAIVIILIGVWTLWGSLRSPDVKEELEAPTLSEVLRDPIHADQDHNQVISWRESLALGMALTLNNIATGIGAGATGISALWTTVITGVLSVLFIGVGSAVGSRIARTWFGRYSSVVAGVLLCLIGLYEILI
ncbi:sporulation membrane protein YtaF [Paenibacillus guangzhouensis]|uniref:sporulation membrane protein YtaF n=1 Tax=Paenibacillus guangzhouensis TaxID=1473112 RepID=UPI001266EBDC|nr:sporulation membrane protein YtaF [Paenibacillus guangzhouensis]